MAKAVNLFNQMAFDLIYTTKNGKQYKEFLQKQLMFPVAILGKDLSITWANEGRNDYIRNLLNGAEQHVIDMKNEGKPQTIKRTRNK